jgi:hypothetical protein
VKLCEDSSVPTLLFQSQKEVKESLNMLKALLPIEGFPHSYGFTIF